ncbi:MAG: MMPL family transporter [Bacteroidota bacterium]
MHQWLKYRRLLLGLVLLLTALFAWNLRNLRVDFSFDKFHPGEDAEVQFYHEFQEKFPHYDNAVQVALKNPGGDLWEPAFLDQVDSIFARWGRISHIDSVLSPTRLQYYRRSGMGVKASPLIRYDSEKAIARSKKRISEDSLLYYNNFSEDGTYIGGIVLIDPDILDKRVRDSLTSVIKTDLEASGLEYSASGVPFIRSAYVEKIRGEMKWFILLAVSLTLVVMFLLYRNWWSTLLPIAGVGIGIVWTLGFMGMTGKSLDMVANLLPSIVFVVAISDVVHLFTRYQQELHRGLSRMDAMVATLKEIGLALFLTSFTTAIGFASLYISPLPPIKEFGWVAAASVIFAFLISIVLIPTALMLVPAATVRESKGAGNVGAWERILERTYWWVRYNGRKVAVTFAVIIGLGIFGASRISLDTYLLDDIGPRDPVRQSMMFFEENFYGARAFEMAIQPREGHSMTDLALLRDLDKIQTFLQQQERISPFLSVVNYLKGANKLYKGGRKSKYVLPNSQDDVDELIGLGYIGQGEKILNLVMTPERDVGRLSARMGDIGSYRFDALTDTLAQFYRTELDTTTFTYRLTGSGIITDQNTVYLRRGLFAGLGLAFGLISLLMGLLYRSWRMLLIGVLPNVIPLLLTAGAMGLMGINLRASTSIVFLVAFGIAVDDTIHFLSRLNIELREGNDLETALLNTMTGTGKAMILTTLILLAGFIFLLTSDFGGTYVVGLFTALTLLIAMVSDLVLLPVLVRWSGLGKKYPPASTDLPPENGPDIVKYTQSQIPLSDRP